jgi:hypothetical protein
MNKPYTEKHINGGTFIREFNTKTTSSELVWHRDKEDRVIEALHHTDWKIQLDNELPKEIKGEICIKKETFHRLIKGSGSLKIRLTKLF